LVRIENLFSCIGRLTYVAVFAPLIDYLGYKCWLWRVCGHQQNNGITHTCIGPTNHTDNTNTASAKGTTVYFLVLIYMPCHCFLDLWYLVFTPSNGVEFV
jgi:hypothetical protein